MWNIGAGDVCFWDREERLASARSDKILWGLLYKICLCLFIMKLSAGESSLPSCIGFYLVLFEKDRQSFY